MSSTLLRLGFLLSFTVPPAALYVLDGENATAQLKDWVVSFQNAKDWIFQLHFWVVCACLSVERIIYTFIWLRPKSWMRMCKQPFFRSIGTPVDVVVKCFWISKVFQFGGFIGWYFYMAPLPALTDITPLQITIGIQFFVIGQILNASIYHAIGKNGVYYGVKLGQRVPWCTGFPFNVFTMHPQYFGANLSAVASLKEPPAFTFPRESSPFRFSQSQVAAEGTTTFVVGQNAP
ncbi:hypothetical protein CYMTET_25858 [Cymbomonas tetramitiformis]|uniref:phosphatidyl-N-methylethanolamine N-methyltransferase n=1 Tax=Cymbomonas tetramitiformis TaxID=36881 RepID=A0AAE0KYR6_9CHLO|nr:hypothetical protein CYMTET_25858 [Cymbomonas tetramitiformis]